MPLDLDALRAKLEGSTPSVESRLLHLPDPDGDGPVVPDIPASSMWQAEDAETLAGRFQSIIPCDFFNRGALDATAGSCGKASSWPDSTESIERRTSQSPISPKRTSSSSAVSSGSIGILAWAMQGPASTKGVMWITVTPVSVSPWYMAQLIGAAPRYFGRSEPCRLIPPRRAVAKVSVERICP